MKQATTKRTRGSTKILFKFSDPLSIEYEKRRNLSSGQNGIDAKIIRCVLTNLNEIDFHCLTNTSWNVGLRVANAGNISLRKKVISKSSLLSNRLYDFFWRSSFVVTTSKVFHEQQRTCWQQSCCTPKKLLTSNGESHHIFFTK